MLEPTLSITVAPRRASNPKTSGDLREEDWSASQPHIAIQGVRCEGGEGFGG
jgi:hypothetical protein